MRVLSSPTQTVTKMLDEFLFRQAAFFETACPSVPFQTERRKKSDGVFFIKDRLSAVRQTAGDPFSGGATDGKKQRRKERKHP